MLGNHRSSMDSPHKGQQLGKRFDVIVMQAYNVDMIREPCASGPDARLSFEGLTVDLAVWLDVF